MQFSWKVNLKARLGKSAGFGRVVPLGFGSFSGALLRGEKNIKIKR
ncbi:hypothetical protein CUP0928 [Campylobacter upsaliensis RM3195]|nr:hypothetical protein CUP0928 [Campylobacter upsaliensis RM3195]